MLLNDLLIINLDASGGSIDSFLDLFVGRHRDSGWLGVGKRGS